MKLLKILIELVKKHPNDSKLGGILRKFIINQDEGNREEHSDKKD